MIDAVRAQLQRAGIRRGAPLCVALSGGLDSVVLLDVMHALRDETGVALSAAHVHHGLSPLADDWAAHCSRLCAVRNIPFSLHHVSLPSETPHGIEAAARVARHGVLRALPADWLVFAHHRDDQAETVLFRLLRGTGVRGAAAMRAVEPGAPGVLRPLLDLPRAALVSHAQSAGLEWVEDPSNADWRFTRNRLRHAILPALETAFPSAAAMLARAACNFDEAQAVLDDVAAEDARRCAADDGWALSLARLRALAPRRQRNLVRALLHVGGFEAPARARLIEAVRQLVEADASALRLPLSGSACAVYRDRVWFEPDPLPEVEGIDCAVLASQSWAGSPLRFKRVSGAGLDASRLEQAGLRLAPRNPGLRLQPAPLRPRRSFKNLCQEAGIPPWWRERLPVLYADGVPVWVGGIGSDVGWQCAPDAPGLVPEWEPAWLFPLPVAGGTPEAG